VEYAAVPRTGAKGRRVTVVLRDGSLTVVGCGIQAPTQVTHEALVHIERAEHVFSLVADPLAEAWLARLNPQTESLAWLYSTEKPRDQTYEEMVSRIVAAVSSGERVCAVAYGHPGVFAYPLHEAIRRIHALDLDAVMLPAVSAEDCLYAELGIDPAETGVCSFEATDFLVYDRHADRTSTLILWQIGVIGERSYKREFGVWNRDGVHALIERLERSYDRDHEVILFQSTRLVTGRSIIVRTPLHALAATPITPLSTLVIPPAAKPVANLALFARLTKASA